MAMFGNRFTPDKVDELFGKVPLATGLPPDANGWAMSAAPIQGPTPDMAAIAASASPLKKPSFFGQGGAGQAILGGLFDSILSQTGGQPVFMPSLLQQRNLAQQEKLRQTQRAEKWDDWQREYDYGIAHPKASNNDTVADYLFRVKTLGQEAADDWLRRGGDPFITANLPNGVFYAGPQSGLATAMQGGGDPASSGGVPQRPVGKLTPIGGR